MNPILMFFVIIAAILLWAILSSIFTPVGSMLKKIYSKLCNEINNDEKEKRK